MKKKKLTALLLGLLMLLSLSACRSGEAESSESPSESANVSDSPAPGESEQIVADLSKTLYNFASGLDDAAAAVTVDGQAVTCDEYFHYLVTICYQMQYYYYMQSGAMLDMSEPEVAKALKEQARDWAAYYTALGKLCQDNGVTLSAQDEAALQGEIDAILEQEGMTLEEYLRSSGLTQEHFRKVMGYSYQMDALGKALVAEPSQADLEGYVEEKGIFSCKHILLKTVTEDRKDESGNVTQTKDEYNEQQKALADNLLARVRTEGDNAEALLDSLAEEYSEDGRNEDGTLAAPDGYTFDESSSLVPGFREGTLALAVGEAGLVETDYGYHVILRLPVDASQYADDWRPYQTDKLIAQAVEEMEVTLSPEVEALDVKAFYDRCVAYTTAVYDELAPEESEEPTASPSEDPGASPSPAG